MSDFLAELAKEASKNNNVVSSPEQTNNKPISNNDFLSQLATQAQEEVKNKPDTNVTPKLGKGLVRGVMDVIDTGASGIGFLDKKIDEFLNGSTGGSQREQKFKERISKEQKEYDEKYGEDLAANIGRVGGQVLATAPLMPARVIQGINIAAKATPTILATGEKVAAPLINRLSAAVGTGGVGGAVYGTATSGSNEKSLGENIKEGVITGAIGGPLVTAAGAGATKLGQKLVGGVSERVADLAKRAEALGIDLKPSQISGSKFFKKLDQVTGWLPFSGQQKLDEKQLSQVARAISRTFGKDTDELSPQLLRQSKTDLGVDYDTVAANTNVRADTGLFNDIRNAFSTAKDTLNKDEFEQFKKQLVYIIDKFQNGQMTGEAWQAMRRTKESMNRIIKRGDNLGNSVKDLRNAMDAAFNRSAPQDMQSLLKQTNAKYKAIKTIEKLVEGSPDGTISPLKLMAAVQKAPGGKLGAGDLGDIADIGRQFFPTPSDSGSPLGIGILNTIASGIQNPMTAAAAGAGAALKGATYIDLGLGGLGLAANRGIREAITGKTLKNAILRQSKGETYTSADKLADIVAPHSAVLAKPSNPLRVVITPKEE